MSEPVFWRQTDPGLDVWIDDDRRRTLEASAADPLLVAKRANQDEVTLEAW
ncbi:hypothetical protein [Micromonospora sediminicola]|uniref:hypothetical protein n=1 Tax=Micromonospora sediminicola TaxID=946078 RepID=UPI000A9B7F68|nr:hypothetical protein [Micromonospora sediminicola]